VPFGGVGAAEAVNFVAEADDVDRLLAAARSVLPGGGGGGGPATGRPPGGGGGPGGGRWGTPGLNAERLAFTARPPLIAPRAPWEIPRLYFLFGEPIDAGPVDPDDPAACAALYAQARGGVEGCVSALLEGRARDPYAAAPPRLLVEALTGRQAPAFDP
jgi:hypothetical protein